jgi:hypothetical protein
MLAVEEVAGHERDIYPDLCDPQWRAVKVTSRGWQVVSDPPPLRTAARARYR